MGYSLIRPSKKMSEVHIFPADFTNQLGVGEFIVSNSGVLQVLVFTGVDPTPNNILLGLPTYVGNVVTQKLQQGVPGVVYRVVLTTTTSTGRHLTLETYLAVLPDDYPVDGVYVTFYETSLPYPFWQQVVDTLHWQPSVIASTLLSGLVNQPIQDTLHFVPSIIGSTLQSTLFTQPIRDTLNYIVTVQAGTLTTILVNNAQQDTMHFSVAVLSSSLLTIVINNAQQDTMNFVPSVQNGTMA